MLNYLVDTIALVVVFAAGAAVGVNNVPTVEKAIAALKSAEAKAAATLATIVEHKTAPIPTVVVQTTTPTT